MRPSVRRAAAAATGPNEPPAAAVAALEAVDVLARLASSPAGLASEKAEERLRRYGPNELPTPRPPHPLRLLFSQISHTLALLLWAAAALAFLAGLPQLGWAILAIILINAGFSFWQEYRAGQLVEALRQRIPLAARVRRDGIEQRIRAADLVAGDVLIVHRGDRVAADGRLLRSTDLRLDYSVLTGESEPVERRAGPAEATALADAPNCVLAGTTVLEGTGEAVVFATAAETVFGQVAALTERLYLEPSPLQRELARTARVIAAVAIAIGVIFFAAGSTTEELSTKDAFLFGVGILVALIPEGLLPTVTLSLAWGVQRMARQNAIVKRLSSVEALGCTNVICTDKTGTLTINEMTARQVWAGDTLYNVTGRGYQLKGALRRADKAGPADNAALDWLLRCAVLCNNGILPHGQRRHVGLGDPLDEALLVLALKGGRDPHLQRFQWPRVKEFPFHAERRRMSTLHRRDGKHLLFVKGGPAETLARCAAELRNGEPQPLDAKRRIQLLERTNEMSDRGLRVLAFALREVGDPATLPSADAAEQEMVFLGLIGLENPLRPEVPAAVARCISSGIQVVMLTGDYPHTALVVARQAGIAGPSAEAVTGARLDSLDDEALARLLAKQRPTVFARVAPEHKLRLVQAYKRLGDVVAVTGDGVNDAPALKAADIGVAMGRTGTDVAREAADMVLMDDNFATIVKAVEQGRGVYENIKKFLTYVLTSNVAEAAPFVLFVLAGVPLPLTVLQVLLVDLGTDMFPALALGVDPAEPGVMQRLPRPIGERMVSGRLLLRALAFLGMLAAAFSLAGYFYVQRDFTGSLFRGLIDEGPLYRQATTMTLAGIVACQVANAFACRSERQSLLRVGFLGNRALLWAVAAEVALLAAVIGLPPLRNVFDLEPIEPQYWPLLAAFPPLFLAAEEGRKLIARRLSRQSR
ncbi:MAG: cation-transporting P-type ATPase [Chloroflexi bacterium]|nr:cation-transporting P-type ATPase [Chloroflexota bacterium]